MQGHNSNLSWLEIEAAYRFDVLNAAAKPSPRDPEVGLRLPSLAAVRWAIGRPLVALGERLSGPRPVGEQPAA